MTSCGMPLWGKRRLSRMRRDAEENEENEGEGEKGDEEGCRGG